ncbi:hypothetical protein TNCV_2168701 [Trichonephila clavipes]|nr:hypothetical protein TNCV_2168701 [Trichonephila clavipes]
MQLIHAKTLKAKSPPAGVVRSFQRRVIALVSYSSLDWGSSLRRLSPTALVLLLLCILTLKLRKESCIVAFCDGALPRFHTNPLEESLGPALSYFTAKPLRKKP